MAERADVPVAMSKRRAKFISGLNHKSIDRLVAEGILATTDRGQVITASLEALMAKPITGQLWDTATVEISRAGMEAA